MSIMKRRGYSRKKAEIPNERGEPTSMKEGNMGRGDIFLIINQMQVINKTLLNLFVGSW